VIYWLAEYPSVVKVALYDPAFKLPKIIEDLFPTKAGLQTFDRRTRGRCFPRQKLASSAPMTRS